MSLKDAIEETDPPFYARDQQTEAMRTRWIHVAHQLRFLGDKLETQYQRQQHPDAVHQEHNWQIYLRNFTVIRNVLLRAWLNCLRYAARIWWSVITELYVWRSGMSRVLRKSKSAVLSLILAWNVKTKKLAHCKHNIGFAWRGWDRLLLAGYWVHKFNKKAT